MYKIGMFLKNRMIYGEGKNYQKALYDLVENSITFNGNWSPQKKWWQFWRKTYPLWIIQAFRDWKISALEEVILSISPEETPFMDALKETEPHDYYNWQTDCLEEKD